MAERIDERGDSLGLLEYIFREFEPKLWRSASSTQANNN